jgi:hypothetical protein
MAGQIGGGMLRGVANTGEAWSQIAQVLANLAAFVPGMKPGATAGIGFPGGPPRPGLVPVR